MAIENTTDCATVIGLAATDGAEQLAIKMRLLELGFTPGEKIRVVAESFPHRDPMAVQLARLSLWLATLSADRPLSFLDHRLQAIECVDGFLVERMLDRQTCYRLPVDTVKQRHGWTRTGGSIGRGLLGESADGNPNKAQRQN